MSLSSVISEPLGPPRKTDRSSLVFPALRSWLEECKSLSGSDEENFVINFIRARHRFGKNKYGTGLTTYNGRDAEIDAIQELGDCIFYLYQMKLENKTISADVRTLLEVVMELASSI